MGVESTPKTVKSAGEASARLVVLAIDLAKAEIPQLPTVLQTVLNSDDVKLGIQQTMNEFYLTRLSEGKPVGTEMGSKDAIELFQAVLKGSGGDVSDGVLKQVKSTPQFKKLEQALKDFEAALKTTPLGVFINKNKTTVFITGIALVVGGAAALFVTKTQSKITDLAVGQLTGKDVQVFKIGNFDLKGSLLSFKPERREIGFAAMGTEKLGAVKVSLKVGVIASATGVQQVNGAVVVKSDKWSVNLTANEAIQTRKTDLHLTLNFDKLDLQPKVGIGMIMHGDKVTGGTLDASLRPGNNWEVGIKGAKDGKSMSGLLMFSIDL